jgi:hypothetical protein
MKKLFRFRSRAVRNSRLKAKNPAPTGKTKATTTKLKPERVTRVARGTINIFAKTVTGEKNLK